MGLVFLLSWLRGREGASVHRSVAVSQGRLVASLPVEAGTELLRVPLADCLLEDPRFMDSVSRTKESNQERAKKLLGVMGELSSAVIVEEDEGFLRGLLERLPREQWQMRLALRLLKEEAAGKNSPWRPFVRALPEFVNSPIFWKADVLRETDYLPVQADTQVRVEDLESFHRKELKDVKTWRGVEVTIEDLAKAFSTCAAHGLELDAGRWGLVPVVDRLAIPDAAGGESCSLSYGGGKDVVVVAARDLNTGDELTQDPKLNADDMFTRYGLILEDDPNNTVSLKLDLGGAEVQKWQMQAVAKELELPGGGAELRVPCCVRLGSRVEEVADYALRYTAMVMKGGCESLTEFESITDPMGVGNSRRPELKDFSPVKRQQMIYFMSEVVERRMQEFSGSLDDDYEEIRKAEGYSIAAILFRIRKKMVLRAARDTLEKSRRDEIRKQVQAGEETTIEA